MATKSQLKQYFETGKIPTQAQFGELIDYIAPMVDDNNNNNKTIIFGDNTKPFIDGFRIIHTIVDNARYTYYLFTMTSKNVSANSIIPYFIIRSSVANNGNGEIATEIHILSNLEVRTYVSKGAGALTATNDIILAIIKNYSYVPLINENIPSYCETPSVSDSIVPGPGTYTLYSSGVSNNKVLYKFYITIIDSKLVLYKFERFTHIGSIGSMKYEIGIIKSLNDDQINKLTIDPNSNFTALGSLITTNNFTIKTQ